MTATAILGLDYAGATKDGRSFDVRTSTGAYAGLISENYKTGAVRVYFNSNATRGSARMFTSIQEAAGYIIERRIKKGWRA
jgi:hypothetical protein